MQLTPTRDVDANLRSAADGVAQAAERGARVVLLPENTGYQGPGSTAPQPEPNDGRYCEHFAALAAQHQLWIIAGTYRELCDEPGKHFNTCPVFDPTGAQVASYRKIHRYDVDIAGGVHALESRYVAAGDELVTVDIDGVIFGLSICYDLRFPELFRALAQRGAQVLTVPSAFRAFTGKDHWEVLLRARAIENQCFVVAADHVGHDDTGIAHHGRSLIADPWGVVLAQAPDRPAIVVADCDIATQTTLRTHFPVLEHAKWSFGA